MSETATLLESAEKQRTAIDELLTQLRHFESAAREMAVRDEQNVNEIIEHIFENESKLNAKEALIQEIQLQVKILKADGEAGENHLNELRAEEGKLKLRLLEIEGNTPKLEAMLNLSLLGMDSKDMDQRNDFVKAAADRVAPKETSLRRLEDEYISLCRVLSSQQAELERMRGEAAGKESRQQGKLDRLNGDYQALIQEVEALNRAVADSRNQYQVPQEKLAEILGDMSDALLQKDALDIERDDLENHLQSMQMERQRCEDEVQRKLREISVTSRAEMRYKLDETMMLLKASVINLNHDYELIESMQTELQGAQAAEREDAFSQYYAEVRDAVVAVCGQYAVVEGSDQAIVEWAENSIYPQVPISKVENLMHCMKRMVICYDFLSINSRLHLKDSYSLIQSSFALYTIATCANARLVEYEAEREKVKAQRLASHASGRSRSRSRDSLAGTPVYTPTDQVRQAADPFTGVVPGHRPPVIVEKGRGSFGQR